MGHVMQGRRGRSFAQHKDFLNGGWKPKNEKEREKNKGEGASEDRGGGGGGGLRKNRPLKTRTVGVSRSCTAGRQTDGGAVS